MPVPEHVRDKLAGISLKKKRKSPPLHKFTHIPGDIRGFFVYVYIGIGF